MLAFATERGTLQPGMPVVEASSGSFGAALAVTSHNGAPCILVVPSNLPIAQRKRLQDLVRISSPAAAAGAAPWSAWPRTPPSATADITPTHFSNDDNPEYHRRVTGRRFIKTQGMPLTPSSSAWAAAASITGVAEYIKAWNSMVRIVAVEPAECAAISGGFIGQHGISGIGPGFVPENYNPYVVDTVLTVTTADAERAARRCCSLTACPPAPAPGDARRCRAAAGHMGKAKRPCASLPGGISTDKFVKFANAPHRISRCGRYAILVL